jgi:bifunctional DNA-binding transcriptional regulator/antitoxin component of YhaV-PrlF toxin-antitoxin module
MKMQGSKMPGPGKCYGSAIVGPRGQLVIPIGARKKIDIDVGTRLMVFDAFGPFCGQGLILLKTEAVEQVLSLMGERMAEVEKMLRESVQGKAVEVEE